MKKLLLVSLLCVALTTSLTGCDKSSTGNLSKEEQAAIEELQDAYAETLAEQESNEATETTIAGVTIDIEDSYVYTKEDGKSYLLAKMHFSGPITKRNSIDLVAYGINNNEENEMTDSHYANPSEGASLFQNTTAEIPDMYNPSSSEDITYFIEFKLDWDGYSSYRINCTSRESYSSLDLEIKNAKKVDYNELKSDLYTQALKDLDSENDINTGSTDNISVTITEVSDSAEFLDLSNVVCVKATVTNNSSVPKTFPYIIGGIGTDTAYEDSLTESMNVNSHTINPGETIEVEMAGLADTGVYESVQDEALLLIKCYSKMGFYATDTEYTSIYVHYAKDKL